MNLPSSGIAVLLSLKGLGSFGFAVPAGIPVPAGRSGFFWCRRHYISLITRDKPTVEPVNANCLNLSSVPSR